MKVIGETRYTLLLEADRNEVRDLAVFVDHDRASDLPVGAEIKVGRLCEQLRQLKARRDQLGHLARDLRLLADLLELKSPLVFPPEEMGPEI